MTRRSDKKLARLDALEAAFRGRLAECLRDCAAGGEPLLFLVSVLRPAQWPPSVRSDVADELFATAAEIVQMREQLGLDGDVCLAARYRDACRRHVDLDDHQRPAARQQAMQLLDQLDVAALTREELEAELATAVSALQPAHAERFAEIAVVPRLVPVASHPGEGVWVVAEHQGRILYYSDIEEGWAIERPDAAGGIAERDCSQFELCHVMWQLFGDPDTSVG